MKCLRVHCVLSLLLFSVAALMVGLGLYIKIKFYKDWKNVHVVMESLISGSSSPMSSDGIEEGLEFLEDSAKKVDTIFWFFTVGAIIVLSRAAVFAVCASKSKSQCLKCIRMEVIERLTETNETEDVELSQTTALEK